MSLLIFDSGFGGLSIRNEIIARLPQLTVHQFSDHANLPYGTKSTDFIRKRLTTVIPELLEKQPISAIVVACNTASTSALDQLRETVATPVIGVVPAIKPAAQLSQLNHIVVLATTATANSPYSTQLIEDFARGTKVTMIAADRLVEFAETKLAQGFIDEYELKSYVNRLLDGLTPYDYVVLACTHFPLLKAELANALSRNVQLIDSGAAIARRVESLLGSEHQLKPSVFYSSAALSRDLQNTILPQFRFSRFEQLSSQ